MGSSSNFEVQDQHRSRQQPQSCPKNAPGIVDGNGLCPKIGKKNKTKLIEIAHVPKNELFTFYQKSTSKVPSHSQPFSKDQTQKLQPHSSLSLPHLPAIGPCPQGLWWHASSALPGRISSENWGHRSIPITKYLVQRCVKPQ